MLCHEVAIGRGGSLWALHLSAAIASPGSFVLLDYLRHLLNAGLSSIGLGGGAQAFDFEKP